MMKNILKLNDQSLPLLRRGLKWRMLLLTCILGTFATGTLAQSLQQDGLAYEVSAGHAVLTQCQNAQIAEVNIPASVTIDGQAYAVKEIGEEAFDNLSNLTSVTFPASITKIGERAFRRCKNLAFLQLPTQLDTLAKGAFLQCGNLTDVTFPNSLKLIGDYCFSETGITQLSLPESVQEIGESAFRSCPKLVVATLPDPLTKIGPAVFRGCGALTTAHLPQSLTQLPQSCFEDCHALTTVTLPNGLTEILPYAFYNCYALPEIHLPQSVVALGYEAFLNCKSLTTVVLPNQLTDEGWGKETFLYCEQLTSAVLPQNVKVLPESTFRGCARLSDITLPVGMTTIGNNAFEGCESLAEIQLPSTLTTIGGAAFYGCSALTHIDLPMSLTSLGRKAFMRCSELTAIVLPDELLEIGGQVFAETKITAITLPKKMTTIPRELLANLTTLETVTLPEKVEHIGVSAFDGCSALQQIDLPEGLLSLGDGAFRNSGLTAAILPQSLNKIEGRIFQYCEKLAEVKLPDNMTEIPRCMFDGCKSLTHIDLPAGVKKIHEYALLRTAIPSIDLPAGLTFIGEQAFWECKQLESIVLPESVTELEDAIFQYCNKLTAVTLPRNLKRIPKEMFNDCSALSAITFPDSLTSIGSYAFSGCSALQEVTFPATLTSLGNCAFRGCTALTTIQLPDELKQLGSGAFEDCVFTSITLPKKMETLASGALSGMKHLQEVILPDSLKDIGSSAFDGCTALQQIDLPEGLLRLGDGAFRNSGLTAAILPQSLNKIEGRIFQYCENLTEVKLPDNMKEIPRCMFQDCKSLTHIDLPAGVKKIHEYALVRTAIPSIELPAGLTFIGGQAFWECKQLESIVLPETVTELESEIFYNCDQLRSVVFPKKLKKIPNGAFYNCRSLVNFTLPDSLEILSNDVFRNCDSLTTVTLPARLTSIGYRTFFGCNALQEIHSLNPQAPQLDDYYGDYAFSEEMFDQVTVFVPSGATGAYQQTEGWKNFKNIIETDGQLLDEVEWKTLALIQDELLSMGSDTLWDFSAGRAAASRLKGLRVSQGHVISLDFSHSKITGVFPYSTLTLPRLAEINLSHNALKGNLAEALAAHPQQQTWTTDSLRKLNISHNDYQGNVYPLTQFFPGLQTLDVSYNAFEEVTPALPEHLSEVVLEHQYTDRVVTLDITHPDVANFWQQLPTIVSYRPATRDYETDLHLLALNREEEKFNSYQDFGALLLVKADQLAFQKYNNYYINEYAGKSGDTLFVYLINKNDYWNDNEVQGFRLRLEFAPGDVNFLPGVDAADLQASILKFMRNYDQLFNFKAADTHADDELNVQDLVCTVNLILNQPAVAQHVGRSGTAVQPAMADAEVYVYLSGNKVILHTTREIGAFEVKAQGKVRWKADAYGLTQSVTDSRIVAYSLEDVRLPAGDHVIGYADAQTLLLSATAADAEAQPLCVEVSNDEITGISTLENDQENVEIYDLSGRRQTTLKKGVNLIRRHGKVLKVNIK